MRRNVRTFALLKPSAQQLMTFQAWIFHCDFTETGNECSPVLMFTCCLCGRGLQPPAPACMITHDHDQLCSPGLFTMSNSAS